MNERLLGIDLGSKLLKLCLAEVDQLGEVKILTTLNKEISSFRNGEIINEDEFLNEVINFLLDFLENFKSKKTRICLSFSSSTFSFQKIRPKSLVEGRYVEENDIKKCKQLGKTSLISSSQEIIYEEASKFYLDGSNTPIRNPLGLEARYLEVELEVVQVFKGFFLKLIEIFKENKIPIEVFLPNPIGGSLSILDQKSKEEGSILIDFGFKTLSLVYFYQGAINHFQVFPFGLENILSDFLNEHNLNPEELLDFLKNLKDFNQQKSIKLSKSKISYQSWKKLLEKKISSLFKKYGLTEIIDKLKHQGPILGGIYILGGISSFPEIELSLRKILKTPTKKAIDLKKELKEEDSIYLNAWGNTLFLVKYSEKEDTFREILSGLKRFFSNLLPF